MMTCELDSIHKQKLSVSILQFLEMWKCYIISVEAEKWNWVYIFYFMFIITYILIFYKIIIPWWLSHTKTQLLFNRDSLKSTALNNTM